MDKQTEEQPSPSPSVDYSRKWYIMASVAMSVLLATIDGSIVNIALPTLVEFFETDFATVQWVGLSYMLVLTTLLLSVGRLADMVGKKFIFMAGFVVFTAGSALCGLAPTISLLVAARILQGVGGAMCIALGAAIVTEGFPPSERGKALGVIGSVVSLGVIIGPVLGGILLDFYSWHWIFFVNIPVGIIGTFMAWYYIPPLKPIEQGQKFDYPGAFTIFVSLIALLLALTIGQQLGFAAPPILLLFATWLIFLVAFLIIEWKASQPMVDLTLFQNELISVSLLMALITFVCVSGTVLLIPFYLEDMLGYEKRYIGMLMAVVPVLLGISAPVSGILADRFGPRVIRMTGLVVLVLGYFLLSFLNEHTTTLLYLVLFSPIGLGMGLFQSPNNSAIMGAAPQAQLGVVSGLLSEARVLGQTLGFAVVGALWASRVFHYAGGPLEGGATAAPISAQIAGLQDTFLAMVGLVVLALGLSIWGLMQHHKHRQRPPQTELHPTRPE